MERYRTQKRHQINRLKKTANMRETIETNIPKYNRKKELKYFTLDLANSKKIIKKIGTLPSTGLGGTCSDEIKRTQCWICFRITFLEPIV